MLAHQTPPTCFLQQVTSTNLHAPAWLNHRPEPLGATATGYSGLPFTA
ncbi:hypothetical protein [Hymenobacter sp.]